MTKNEARAILSHVIISAAGFRLNQNGEALKVLCEPPSIAQSIRNAAINWPQYLGDVECEILDAFCERDEWHTSCKEWQFALLNGDANYKVVARTFMLFVAEALE